MFLVDLKDPCILSCPTPAILSMPSFRKITRRVALPASNKIIDTGIFHKLQHNY